jgi:hypothetical protein
MILFITTIITLPGICVRLFLLQQINKEVEVMNEFGREYKDEAQMDNGVSLGST